MAYALTTMGIELGSDLLPAQADNERGFWEDAAIVRLNEDILQRAGSTWHSLDPALPTRVAGFEYIDLRERAIDLVGTKLHPGRWFGAKDPRFCRLLPFWLDVLSALGAEVRVVHGVRNPLSVARSLAARDGFEQTKSSFLWLNHVIASLSGTVGFRQTVLDYDLLMGDPERQVRRLAADLGFEQDLDDAAVARFGASFLSQRLRHAQAGREELRDTPGIPSLVPDVYATLVSAASGEASLDSAATRSAFAQYRERFSEYAPLLSLAADREQQNSVLAERAALLDDLASSREIEIGELQSALQDRDAAIEGRDAAIEGRDAAIEERDAVILVRDEVIRSRDARITDQQTQVKGLEARANALAHDRDRLDIEVRTILASTSWRVTRPMRVAMGVLRGNSIYRERLTSMLRAATRSAVAGSAPPEAGANEAHSQEWAREPPNHSTGSNTDTDEETMTQSTARPVRIVSGLLRRDAAYWAQLRASVGPMGRFVPDLSAAVSELPAPLSDGTMLRVIYISGEPHTPGHWYRVLRYAESARACGASVAVIPITELKARLPEIHAANVLIIWRAEWRATVQAAVSMARSNGAKVIFDVDDLMFAPKLAKTAIIDGIRTQELTEAEVKAFYSRIRETMLHADFCTVTTEELAEHARRLGLSVRVLPNGFDEHTFRLSRRAARAWATTRDDDYIRLGYAGGSRTHQRDFGLCAGAVAQVLRDEPRARLVLFRVTAANTRLIDIEEFPALTGLEDRIEWRELVPLERLPEEMARFDVNLAPLEVQNPFCEAKSELKYFEGALAGVPTVASPTGPFRRCIKDGETGLLAASEQDWTVALKRLVGDASLRAHLAKSALQDAQWRFGPERRTDAVATALDMLRGGRRAAHAFAYDLMRKPSDTLVQVPPNRTLFHHDQLGDAEATVVVPLHNYAHLLTEALDSVSSQTLKRLDLIIVDDVSADDGVAVAKQWASMHAERFNRLLILQNVRNSGLGLTRNVGFSAAETLYVMPLDPDNRLMSDCLERCVDRVRHDHPAFVYPVIRLFGDESGVVGTTPYDPNRLIQGNYIDAMALVSKPAWTVAGGYDHVRFGWEDYDFWCRLAERGLFGAALGGTPAAEYRVHGASMLRTTTDVAENKRALISDISRRHSWLSIPGTQ
mgnify:FL=1